MHPHPDIHCYTDFQVVAVIIALLVVGIAAVAVAFVWSERSYPHDTSRPVEKSRPGSPPE